MLCGSALSLFTPHSLVSMTRSSSRFKVTLWAAVVFPLIFGTAYLIDIVFDDHLLNLSLITNLALFIVIITKYLGLPPGHSSYKIGNTWYIVMIIIQVISSIAFAHIYLNRSYASPLTHLGGFGLLIIVHYIHFDAHFTYLIKKLSRDTEKSTSS